MKRSAAVGLGILAGGGAVIGVVAGCAPALRRAGPPAPGSSSLVVAPAASSPGGRSGAVPSEAIVWVPDPAAPYGLRSEWLRLVPGAGEPASGRVGVGTAVERVASRPGPVLVGERGLFELGTHPRTGEVCADCAGCQAEGASLRCASPGQAEVRVPHVRALGGERVASPWELGTPPSAPCEVADWEQTFELAGAVGPVLLGEVHTYAQYCGAAHGLYTSEPFGFDLDRGAFVRPELDPDEVARLRAAVHPRFLVEHADCLLDPEQPPEPWWVTVAWSPEGTLTSTQQFIMGAPYACGTGPGHYSVLLEEATGRAPRALARWARLPAWVAAWRAAHDGRWAFVLGAQHAAWLARFGS